MKAVTNEQLGAAISDMSLCAVYLLSATGEVLSWNRGARLIKGWQSRDITGLHFSVFYDDEERIRNVPEANLKAAYKHGRFVSEGWRLRRDGRVFRALIEIEFLSPSKGDEAAFIKIVRDISPEHQARVALNSAQQVIISREAELSEASGLLDEIFNRTPCPLILCDAESGDITRANPISAQNPKLRKLVLSGNVKRGQSAELPGNLAAAFCRGLNLFPGDGFSETLNSEEPVPEFAFRLTADRFTAGSSGDAVLFTLQDITSEYQAVATAKHMALHDPLTGLFNRRGLLPALDALLHCGAPFAIILFDIDRFKRVNDVLGHPAGDALLAEVAERLRLSQRPEDILARTGGDEFVAVIPGLDTPEAAAAAVSRLAARLREPFMLEGRRIISGGSFGISLFPDQAADAESMMSAADIALYAAKSSGRNRWVIFSDQLATKAAERLSLENDLRSALYNGELQLFYQPVVSSASEVVISYEVLLNWQHPSRGNVSPDVFLPLADETGLIHEIGSFALVQACIESAHWPGDERVAVKISPRQFRDPQLSAKVRDALLRSGLAPGKLELEITESALFENPEDSYQIIREFRDAGINIVLDDFGSCFSSLNHLRSGMFSRIIIAPSFICNLNLDADTEAITSSILSLCNKLRLEATAAGVETYEQAEWLKKRGCSLLQGHLYGKPMPQRLLR
ncbi:hypothetical protein ERHA54_50470 (plasmid) [Erwinia rhapontici]|uniref:putative bifunctional diguanylate cyclase/phosphodiesterase n=1 Tax=Erwinia rhapontici TaxID=55212 RepID=UPI001BB3FDB7|nr:EAL domain-containing protein [Erwinia rhapontici]BCQ42444.1 hypothetical protein ERHA54_50470 [Erwinia rhapontici]